jgi:hypothetical protein
MRHVGTLDHRDDALRHMHPVNSRRGAMTRAGEGGGEFMGMTRRHLNASRNGGSHLSACSFCPLRNMGRITRGGLNKYRSKTKATPLQNQQLRERPQRGMSRRTVGSAAGTFGGFSSLSRFGSCFFCAKCINWAKLQNSGHCEAVFGLSG